FVKGRIHIVDVLLAQLIFGQTQTFSKSLEVDDLPGSEEFDDVVDVRVVAQPQNIVVGNAGLLLCRQVLGKVGDQIALYRHAGGVPGRPGGGGGIDTGSMVHEVGIKPGGADLLLGQVPGQLMHNGADHLQVPKFFYTNIC